MDEWINYDQFDRQTWHSFFPSEITFLTQENLDEIKSLNDQISLRDVQDIYLPLIKLIQLQYQNYQQMQLQKMTFLRKSSRRFNSALGYKKPSVVIISIRRSGIKRLSKI